VWVPEGVGKLASLKRPLPPDGSVYDWVYDALDSGGSWRQWMDTVPAQAISPEAEYTDIIVRTLDVVRITFLLRTLVASHTHTLLVSEWGLLMSG
jgi:dynein heavy chain